MGTKYVCDACDKEVGSKISLRTIKMEKIITKEQGFYQPTFHLGGPQKDFEEVEVCNGCFVKVTNILKGVDIK